VWFRKRKPDLAAAARELREQAFSITASEIGISPSGAGVIWSILMETGYPEAVATLLAAADGTTSLYFSNGGGIIGAGDHENVRAAATRFLALANENRALLTATRDHPMPGVGRVRFYARTFDGLLTGEADETDLGEERHALSPLFYAGHDVITAVREAEPNA